MEYQEKDIQWPAILPAPIRYTPEPEESPLPEKPIPPAPIISSSSSLFTALDIVPPPQPIRRRNWDRSSPPPFYNPYPYAKTWTLERKLDGRQRWFWHHREDDWMHDVDGDQVGAVRRRVAGVFINGLANKQRTAKREWEEAQILQQNASASGSASDPPFVFQFITKQQEKGISVKTLMGGRRAIEAVLDNPKKKIFEKYPHDTMEVRIKWPAYPDHEPVRTILVTLRTGNKRSRRPCTSLEFAVALAGVITQFYSEVSHMQPHPAFAHLALGPGDGRISLYALRLFGVRTETNGVLELELEQEGLSSPPALPPSERPVAGPSIEAAEGRNSEEGASEGAAQAVYPPWERTLPVTCVVASPPKVTAAQYLAHVDPLATANMPLPAWPDK